MAKEESGFKEKEIAQFIREASDVIGRILEKDKRKGYRLGIYKEADIIEGGSRAVARELIELQENMKELCNIITTINQVNFERVEDQKRVAMDGFKIDFDLNTFREMQQPVLKRLK